MSAAALEVDLYTDYSPVQWIVLAALKPVAAALIVETK